MGVPHFNDFERLRVIVWASAVMTRSGGRSAPARHLFSGPNGKGQSTHFYRCLAEGRPWPDFVGTQDAPGPALAIEAKFPGTLIWLIHPLWNGLNDYLSCTLEHTYLEILAMRASVQEIMSRAHDDATGDWESRLHDTCKALHDEGSLDALFALALIPRQAFCMSRADIFPHIARQAVTFIPGIQCLEWMPSRIQQLFSTMVCRIIVEEQPQPVTVDLARERRHTRLWLDIAHHTDKEPQGIDEVLEIALEGSGVIKKKGDEQVLSPTATEILGRLAKTYGSASEYLAILDRLDSC